MRQKIAFAIVALLSVLLLAESAAFAQYSKAAAQNEPTREVRVEVEDAEGNISYERRQVAVAADSFGNAAGNQYDLAVDGAFEGQTIVVLHMYTQEGFNFALPKKALAEKGFSVYRWMNKAPSAEELQEALDKACQLWVISGASRQLDDGHLKVIKKFFDSGKGVYIWGDNQPYYADANFVAEGLFGASMQGNLIGNKNVTLQEKEGAPGLLEGHLLTTGLKHIYEGITIATIQENDALEPLIYGSAGNLVAAFYDHGGKRAILDGGFTRLYCNWDTAGTARYVKNAAAWLVNYERFGDDVVAENVREDDAQ